jgi:hypothetical protein
MRADRGTVYEKSCESKRLYTNPFAYAIKKANSAESLHHKLSRSYKMTHVVAPFKQSYAFSIPPTTTPFRPADHFRLDRSHEASIRFSHVGKKFTELYVAGCDVLPAPKQMVQVRVLEMQTSMTDTSIIAALGVPIEHLAISLYDFYYTLARQRNGESGILPTNGRSTIAYIQDCAGACGVVNTAWHGFCWGIDTNPITCKNAWGQWTNIITGVL